MAKSAMDYVQMQQLIVMADAAKSNMISILDDLATYSASAISEVYSGEAADATKNKINSVKADVVKFTEEIIQSLTTKANEKEAEYAAQDAKMKSSISNNA